MVFLAIGLVLFAAVSFHGFGPIQDVAHIFNSQSSGLRVALFGVPAVFIVFGAIQCESLFEGALVRMAAYLGDASYSLYLFHLPVFFVIGHFLAYIGYVYPWLFVIAPIGAIVTSVVVWEFLEKPMLAFFRERAWRRNDKVKALVRLRP
jgi:exopolysaccharide production protein ExoZ